MRLAAQVFGLVMLSGSTALAGTPQSKLAPPAASIADIDAGLAIALQLYREHDWAQAMDVLEDLGPAGEADPRADRLWEGIARTVEAQMADKLVVGKRSTLAEVEAIAERIRLQALLVRARNHLERRGQRAPEAPLPPVAAFAGPASPGADQPEDGEVREPGTQPTSTPAATKPKPPAARPIPNLVPSAADFKKYQIDRDYLKTFNEDIAELNARVREGAPFSELKDYLNRVNESGLDLAERYPPAIQKVKGILSRYADPIRQQGMRYYGTRGTLELSVNGGVLTNADLGGGYFGGPGPPGYEFFQFTMKSYRRDHELLGAEVYAITRGGTQYRALGPLELPREPLGSWIASRARPHEFTLPDRVVAGAAVHFSLLFPAHVAGDVKEIVYIDGPFQLSGDRYRIEIPVWGNLL